MGCDALPGGQFDTGPGVGPRDAVDLWDPDDEAVAILADFDFETLTGYRTQHPVRRKSAVGTRREAAGPVGSAHDPLSEGWFGRARTYRRAVGMPNPTTARLEPINRR